MNSSASPIASGTPILGKPPVAAGVASADSSNLIVITDSTRIILGAGATIVAILILALAAAWGVYVQDMHHAGADAVAARWQLTRSVAAAIGVGMAWLGLSVMWRELRRSA